METKQVTEYKVFVLCLANMRGGVDKSIPVAVFTSLENLKAYYQSQLADSPWKDEPSADTFGNVHGYSKVFKKGSPLEWFNPLNKFEPQSWQDVAFGGVIENWVDHYPESADFTVPLDPS